MDVFIKTFNTLQVAKTSLDLFQLKFTFYKLKRHGVCTNLKLVNLEHELLVGSGLVAAYVKVLFVMTCLS